MGFDPGAALVEGARGEVGGGPTRHHRSVVDVGDGLDVGFDGRMEGVWHEVPLNTQIARPYDKDGLCQLR